MNIISAGKPPNISRPHTGRSDGFPVCAIILAARDGRHGYSGALCAQAIQTSVQIRHRLFIQGKAKAEADALTGEIRLPWFPIKAENAKRRKSPRHFREPKTPEEFNYQMEGFLLIVRGVLRLAGVDPLALIEKAEDFPSELGLNTPN